MNKALERYLSRIPTEKVIDDRFFQYSRKAFEICKYLTDDVISGGFSVSLKSMGTPECESRLVDLGDEFIVIHDIELDGLLRELDEALNGGVVHKKLVFRLQKFVVNRLAAKGVKGYAAPFALNKIWATDLDPFDEEREIFVEMQPDADDLSQRLQKPKTNLYPQDLFVLGHEFGHILSALGRFSFVEEHERIVSMASSPPRGLQLSSRMFLTRLESAIQGSESFPENRNFFEKLVMLTSDRDFLEEAFCDRVAWEIVSSLEPSTLELNSEEEVGLSAITLMRGILLLNALVSRIDRVIVTEESSESYDERSARSFFRMKLVDLVVEEELHNCRLAAAQNATDYMKASLSYSAGGHELVRKRAAAIESVVFQEVFTGLGRLEEHAERINKHFDNPYLSALFYMLYDLPEHDTDAAMQDVGQFYSDGGREVLHDLKERCKISLCSPKKQHQENVDKIMNESIF